MTTFGHDGKIFKSKLGRTIAASVAAIFFFEIAFQDASFAMSTGSTDSGFGAAKGALAASQAQSFQADLFSGSAATAVPIFVPPGRRGLQPSVALTYSSQGGNSWAGVGWNLDQGAITRSTKNGVVDYSLESERKDGHFVLSFNGINSELVDISGTGTEFRVQDEGQFLKIIRDTTKQTWTIYDKSGTRTTFGQNNASRVVVNANAQDQIFQWRIDSVVDTNGNYMDFIYGDENGNALNPSQKYTEVYLKQIRYAGWYDLTSETLTEQPTHMVEFTLESAERPDILSSFASGAEIKTTKRLKYIKTIVSNQTSREYVLNYETSKLTNRSLLVGVEEYGTGGKEDPSAANKLPDKKFTYQQDEPQFELWSNNPGSLGDNLWNIRVAGADLFGSNESILLPDGSFVGAVDNGTGNGTKVNFGEAHTSRSGQDGDVAWNVSANGAISITGQRDWQFHIYTYLYFPYDPAPTTINFDSPGAVWAAYLNGRIAGYAFQSAPSQATFDFQEGYNLLEFTGYNQNDSFGFNIYTQIATELGSTFMTSKQFIKPQLTGDFNGDGITDLGYLNPDNNDLQVSLSANYSFAPPSVWSSGFLTKDDAPLLADFNGDGLTDLCKFKNGQWIVALSTGSGFNTGNARNWVENNGSFGSGEKPLTGDFNGDGRLDIGYYKASTGEWNVALSKRILISDDEFLDVFEPDGVWISGFSGGDHFAGDFNGDGLTDILTFSSGSWQVALNNGSEFVSAGTWASNFGAGQEPLLMDYNTDGRTDIGFFDKSQSIVKVMRSNGHSAFENEITWIDDFTLKGQDYSFQPGDFSGDGIVDPAILNAYTQQSQILFSKGDIADLMVKMDNGRGGTTTIKYRPSTEKSAYTPSFTAEQLQSIPFIIPVIYEVSVNDGMGNTTKMGYTFDGGKFETNSRQFRGFEVARVYDADGNTIEHYFYQFDKKQNTDGDWEFKGKVYKKVIKDSYGKTYAVSQTKWTNLVPYNNIFFATVKEQIEKVFEGDETFKQTKTAFEYDPYGNLAKIFEYGECATEECSELTGDERTTIHQYTYNTAKNIVDKLAVTSLYKGIQVSSFASFSNSPDKLTERKFYYDNNVNVSDEPIKGDLTKEERWLSTGLNPTTQMTHDKYGNVKTVRDPRNNTATNEYDSTTNIFLTKITNTLGQAQSMTYDARIGQILTTTDVNNQLTKNVYDLLGRVVKQIGPKDSDQSPSVEYEYRYFEYDTNGNPNPAKPNRKITRARVNHGQLPTVDTYDFTDGLDRAIQGRSPAEESSEQVVTGVVTFDKRAQVKYQYSSYFDNFSQEYVPLDSGKNVPKTEAFYDALGRTVKLILSDGTIQQQIYGDWETTSIDQEGSKKKEFYDAFGRLSKVEEYNCENCGGPEEKEVVYATSYEYDLLGNLVKTIDDHGNVVQIFYDSLARKTAMDDPDMGHWEYVYDQNNNLFEQKDAKGNRTTFEYDILNRLVNKKLVKTGEEKILAHYVYDESGYGFSKGRLTTATDASGTAHPTYDELGQVIKQERVFENVTYTSFNTSDALGRPVDVTYPDGEVLHYEYNNFGDVEKMYSNKTSYVDDVDYNPSGQIVYMKYGNGSETNYEYDLQTLRLKHLDTTAQGKNIQDFDYTFDNIGNVKSITDHVNTASQIFGYDNLYRLISATGASYGTHGYEYDSIGNRMAQVKNSERTDYLYGENGDPIHALTSAKKGSEIIANYSYDLNGNLEKKVTPTTGVSSYNFNEENRLASSDEFDSIDHTLTLNLTQGWNFISLPFLPEDSKITSVLSSLAAGTDYLQVSRFNADKKDFEHFVNNSDFNDFDSFEYGRGYLIWMQRDASVTVNGKLPSQNVVLPIKQGNNLISFATADEAGLDVTAALKDLKLNEDYSDILTYNGSGYSSFVHGDFTKVYPGKAYYLVALQDLELSLAPANETTQFVYDAGGARVKKIMGTDSITYLGQDYEVAKYLGTGFTSAYTTVTSKYIFLGGRRIAAREDNGSEVKVYFYHSDHLGGSNTITDDAGKQVELIEYTPYGEMSRHDIDPNTRERRHKFTGQEQDKETGLYYYGARYYDPEIGRFISPDSVIQDPSDPQFFNRYAYARNNPVNLVDPTGNIAFLALLWVISQIAFWVSVGATIVSFIAYYSGDYKTAALFGKISRIAGIISTVAGSIAQIGNTITAALSTAEQSVANAAPTKIFGLFSTEIPDFGFLDVLDLASIGLADTSAGPILNDIKLVAHAWNTLSSLNGANPKADSSTTSTNNEGQSSGLNEQIEGTIDKVGKGIKAGKMVKPLGTLLGAGIGAGIGYAASGGDENYLLAGAAAGGLFGYMTSGAEVGVTGWHHDYKVDDQVVSLNVIGVGGNAKILGIPLYHISYNWGSVDLNGIRQNNFQGLLKESFKNYDLLLKLGL